MKLRWDLIAGGMILIALMFQIYRIGYMKGLIEGIKIYTNFRN